MIDENKQKICDALCTALKMTMAGEDLVSIRYEKVGIDTERATLLFQNGYTYKVNVSLDSGAGMIRDIMKHI